MNTKHTPEREPPQVLLRNSLARYCEQQKLPLADDVNEIITHANKRQAKWLICWAEFWDVNVTQKEWRASFVAKAEGT